MPRRATYTRKRVDERREELLRMGRTLFARHALGELSMSRIAREAGISKALLYHYFPSKQSFFMATLQDAAEDLARRVEPDPALAPEQALVAGLDAFLDWVEEHRLAYRRLVETAGSLPEVAALVDVVRQATAVRILEGLGAGDPPAPARRAAVRAWLWFVDGAVLDWLEHGDLDRPALRAVLLGALHGALGPSDPAGVTPAGSD